MVRYMVVSLGVLAQKIRAMGDWSTGQSVSGYDWWDWIEMLFGKINMLYVCMYTIYIYIHTLDLVEKLQDIWLVVWLPLLIVLYRLWMITPTGELIFFRWLNHQPGYNWDGVCKYQFDIYFDCWNWSMISNHQHLLCQGLWGPCWFPVISEGRVDTFLRSPFSPWLLFHRWIMGYLPYQNVNNWRVFNISPHPDDLFRTLVTLVCMWVLLLISGLGLWCHFACFSVGLPVSQSWRVLTPFQMVKLRLTDW